MITNPTKSKIAEEMIQLTICLTSIKQSLNSVFPSGFFFFEIIKLKKNEMFCPTKVNV